MVAPASSGPVEGDVTPASSGTGSLEGIGAQAWLGFFIAYRDVGYLAALGNSMMETWTAIRRQMPFSKSHSQKWEMTPQWMQNTQLVHDTIAQNEDITVLLPPKVCCPHPAFLTSSTVLGGKCFNYIVPTPTQIAQDRDIVAVCLWSKRQWAGDLGEQVRVAVFDACSAEIVRAQNIYALHLRLLSTLDSEWCPRLLAVFGRQHTNQILATIHSCLSSRWADAWLERADPEEGRGATLLAFLLVSFAASWAEGRVKLEAPVPVSACEKTIFFSKEAQSLFDHLIVNFVHEPTCLTPSG